MNGGIRVAAYARSKTFQRTAPATTFAATSAAASAKIAIGIRAIALVAFARSTVSAIQASPPAVPRSLSARPSHRGIGRP